MTTQEQVWDDIAPEWHEYKKIPAYSVITFLKDQEGKILDLGAGSGRNMHSIKNGQMYLTDFSQKMLDLAEERAKKEGIKIETKKSVMWEIPYEDNFFDGAICISALHCVEGAENRKKTLEELHRVLKSEGQALIGVWNIKSKRFRNKRPERMIGWQDKGERYYYLHTEEEIHNLCKEIGFKVVSSCNSEMMINFVVQK